MALSAAKYQIYDTLGRVVGPDAAGPFGRWDCDSKAEGSACGADMGRLREAATPA